MSRPYPTPCPPVTPWPSAPQALPPSRAFSHSNTTVSPVAMARSSSREPRAESVYGPSWPSHCAVTAWRLPRGHRTKPSGFSSEEPPSSSVEPTSQIVPIEFSAANCGPVRSTVLVEIRCTRFFVLYATAAPWRRADWWRVPHSPPTCTPSSPAVLPCWGSMR